MPVPNTFGNATATIALSDLDNNFATPITIGNTAVQLGNTVSTLNNMSLANVTISSVASTFPNNYLANSSVTIGNTSVSLGGTITTIGNLTLTNANITSLSSTLTVPQGGTGLVTISSGALLKGNGTGSIATATSGVDYAPARS